MLTTIDVVLFRWNGERLELMLWKRHPDADVYPNQITLPGGFISDYSKAELADVVNCLIEEKIGVQPAYLEQVCTVGNANRDPRGWSITVLHLALIPYSQSAPFSDEQRWVDAKKYAQPEGSQSSLPFDHNKLIQLALERLSSKAQYTALPLYLAEPVTTLPELQKLYEEILDNKLHKKAFRDRLFAAHLLEDTGDRIQGRGSPKAIYRIQQQGVVTFDRLMQGHKKEELEG